MGLAWDGERERVVVEALAQTAEAEEAEVEPLSDADEGPDALRVRLTAERRAAPSSPAPSGSWPPAGRRARCAACRSTPRGTSARGQNGHRR